MNGTRPTKPAVPGLLPPDRVMQPPRWQRQRAAALAPFPVSLSGNGKTLTQRIYFHFRSKRSPAKHCHTSIQASAWSRSGGHVFGGFPQPQPFLTLLSMLKEFRLQTTRKDAGSRGQAFFRSARCAAGGRSGHGSQGRRSVGPAKLRAGFRVEMPMRCSAVSLDGRHVRAVHPLTAVRCIPTVATQRASAWKCESV